jgi:hypothetical protein
MALQPNSGLGPLLLKFLNLDEWSARRRGLYLHRTTQHINTRDKHPCPEGIRTRDSSNQAAADLDCAANGIGFLTIYLYICNSICFATINVAQSAYMSITTSDACKIANIEGLHVQVLGQQTRPTEICFRETVVMQHEGFRSGAVTKKSRGKKIFQLTEIEIHYRQTALSSLLCVTYG